MDSYVKSMHSPFNIIVEVFLSYLGKLQHYKDIQSDPVKLPQRDRFYSPLRQIKISKKCSVADTLLRRLEKSLLLCLL